MQEQCWANRVLPLHWRSDVAAFVDWKGAAGLGAVVRAAGVAPWASNAPTARRLAVDEAAAHTVDLSLDFVYLDGGTIYSEIQDALARWYPKVRLGGVVAGNGYLNGVLMGQIHGVKMAVDDLAAEQRGQVCVTLDHPPAWFLVKPNSHVSAEATQRRRLALLTAHDAAQSCLAAVSSPNKARYCSRHGYRFVEETGGFELPRAPAWSKILFLKNHLRDCDWLFWSDADSLVMDGSTPLERFLDEDYDVIIAREDFDVGTGNVNAGQLFLKNSDWSFWFLDEVWAQTQFIGHPMEEQAAVIHLLHSRELSRHVKVVTQRSFNSYPLNYRRGDFLLHFAGFRGEHRLRQMRVFEQFSTVE